MNTQHQVTATESKNLDCGTTFVGCYRPTNTVA